MRLLSLLLFALAVSRAHAQTDERVGVQTVWVVGAQAAGLAGAGVALDGMGWTGLNPATTASATAPGIRLYADQGFGLPELRAGALHLTFPFSVATFSAGAQTLGFDAYRVSNASVGAARAFALGTSRRVAAGALVVLHHAQVQGYGSGAGLALDVGVQAEVAPGLRVGASGRNVAAGQLAGIEPLPQVLAAGLAFAPEARVRVVADAVKDTRFPLSLRVGVEVAPLSLLALRVGAATEPTLFSAGAGLRLGRLHADLAATRHDVLGWTPAVELGVSW